MQREYSRTYAASDVYFHTSGVFGVEEPALHPLKRVRRDPNDNGHGNSTSTKALVNVGPQARNIDQSLATRLIPTLRPLGIHRTRKRVPGKNPAQNNVGLGFSRQRNRTDSKQPRLVPGAHEARQIWPL
jgi:hypothetical protein